MIMLRSLKVVFFVFNVLFFYPIIYADDPCNEISGNWQGTLSYIYYERHQCIWQISAVGSSYNDLFRLNISRYNGQSPTGDKCLDSTFSISGTCKNGKLEASVSGVAPVSGIVFGGEMDLNGSGHSIKLYKK
jgi:hypothetical protein